VTAEKSTTEFKTDRRVFNVGTDLTSSGASALEVLNNVPSVNVDIEGSVSLRGCSGVQILLNGKPSVIADEESGALGNITADMIEKIEVITNPSAKYEAEGTAGIINIILKKNNKKALNGSISLNTGFPDNHSVGVSLNKRTENFNLFTQFGVGFKERVSDTENRNNDFNTGINLNSIGDEARNEGYYNLVLGTDYYINPLNVITLSGSFTYEIEDQPSFTEFELFENGLSTTGWTRSETTSATNPKLQYELQYKREFEDDKEHTLGFSAIGNYFGKDQSSVFTETLLNGQRDLTDQLTNTKFDEGKFTFNLDYTKPLLEDYTIEVGAQYVDNRVSNDYAVEDLVDGEYVIDEGLTNLFEYDQKVFGTYVTGAYEGAVYGLKLGLRAEHTDLSTLLTNTNEDNNQQFLNWFPSAHVSYKLSDGISLQAGYSKRIYRPRLWDLNPFFNIRNNFSIRAGNPLLMPEFTDSYEIGSIFIFDAISFNVNVYQRVTTDKIERISTFTDNVRVFSPLNVGTADTKGLEVNFKYTPFKKITFNGDFNYNFFQREGVFGDQEFDFSNDQWGTKITSKIKAHKNLDFEITGRYSSEVQTVQGIQSANLFMDFGTRYKIAGGKIVLNLSVRDVFASRIRESFVFDDNFETYSFRQLGRFVSFGVSYGFGKGEAITYGGRGRRR
jgi:outer membrane receptor protein involved in Fe transport